MRELFCNFDEFNDMNLLTSLNDTNLRMFFSQTSQAGPKNFREAMTRSDAEKQIQANQSETKGLFERKVFDIVDPPKDKTIMDTTIVLKSKKDPVTGQIVYKPDIVSGEISKKKGLPTSKTRRKALF